MGYYTGNYEKRGKAMRHTQYADGSIHLTRQATGSCLVRRLCDGEVRPDICVTFVPNERAVDCAACKNALAVAVSAIINNEPV